MPDDYYLGLKNFSEYNDPVEDTEIHDIKKFIRLASKGNPGLLELLYVADNHILKMDEYGERLRQFRRNFLSKEVYARFGGYAYSQFQKLMFADRVGKRAELIDKYGFDCKNASHCLRLYFEGIELLNDGELTLPLVQRQEILDVKMGRVKLEEVLKRNEDLKKQFEYAYLNTKLPKIIDFELINEFLIELIYDYRSK